MADSPLTGEARFEQGGAGLMDLGRAGPPEVLLVVGAAGEHGDGLNTRSFHGLHVLDGVPDGTVSSAEARPFSGILKGVRGGFAVLDAVDHTLGLQRLGVVP